VLATIFAAAAMAQDVNFSFERDANFRAFESYAWVDMNDGGQPLDELTANQLKSAVEAELAMKGLQKTDSAQADLLIGYQTAFRKEREVTVYNAGWGYGPGWRTTGSAHRRLQRSPLDPSCLISTCVHRNYSSGVAMLRRRLTSMRSRTNARNVSNKAYRSS